MTKPRKLHQLTGTIKCCFSGKVSNQSPYKGQPFYCLEIISESLFTDRQSEIIYVFPNLVSSPVWKLLEQEAYKDKKYLFWCEKRTRGWRLKEMEEVKPFLFSQQNC